MASTTRLEICGQNTKYAIKEHLKLAMERRISNIAIRVVKVLQKMRAAHPDACNGSSKIIMRSKGRAVAFHCFKRFKLS